MTSFKHDAATDSLVSIMTPSGRLVGRRRRDIASFKGIPYAAPPVGTLRWRPPQALTPWQDTRFALDFGPAPLQTLPPRSSLMYRLNNDDARALVMSEDCLYLNVWSPDPSPGANLPVLVWLHGGANRSGHGSQDLFEGSRLAARGVVVVTLTMRLGALGFLSLPELARENALGASGNYGLMDAAAALQWVRRHISAFGGDAHKVTLAGNSSGSALIAHLMAAPAARGLFRAAIGQSASGIFRPEGAMTTHQEAAQSGQALTAALGGSLNQLRDLPATAFLSLPPQNIVIDGCFLTEDSTQVFLDGRQAPLPLLAGWNADEGSLYASRSGLDALMSTGAMPPRSALDACYPQAFTETGTRARRNLVGDKRFAYPMWRWARTHAETSPNPTWLYLFDHDLPVPEDLPPPPDGGQGYGSFHTAELPYIWDNLGLRDWAWREADHALAQTLADTWARFVIHGDPNGPGLPNWAPLDAQADLTQMRLSTAPEMVRLARRSAFDCFDDAYWHAHCSPPLSCP